MRAWIPYIVMIAGLLGSTQAASAGEAFPRVLVTVPALTPYVNDLLHGITTSQNLLRPGQDAHGFSLSSRQRRALAEADVIIIADKGMSPFLNKMLDAEQKRGATVVVLTALKKAEPLSYRQENPWLKVAKAQAHAGEKDAHAHHDDHDHEEQQQTDPHLWLDPLRMAALAVPLAEAIAARSPSHSTQLQANATTLAKHLRDEVDPALRAIVSIGTPQEKPRSKPLVPLITYHAGYQYFMARYGLTNNGEIVQRPEEYLGAKTLRDTMAQADRVTIGCIISESDSPLVRRIAKASGARMITLSPEAPIAPTEISSAPWARNDYERLLQKTAEQVASCL